MTANQTSLDQLLGIIENVRAKDKTLVLEKQVNNILSLVTPFSKLQQHGIERVVWLESPNLESMLRWDQQSSIVYMSYGQTRETEIVCRHIRSYIASAGHGNSNGNGNGNGSSAPEIHVILVGSEATRMAFRQALEEESLLGDVNVHVWPVSLLYNRVESAQNDLTQHNVHEDDILTLNLGTSLYKDLVSGGVDRTVYLSALALERIQQQTGPIPSLVGKGTNAQAMIDTMLRLREGHKTSLVNLNTEEAIEAVGVGIGDVGGDSEEMAATNAARLFAARNANVFLSTDIDTLVVVDRTADLLTPVLTQLTYEGLIDEFYRISTIDQVDLPRSIVDVQNPAQASNPGGTNNTNSNTNNPGDDLNTGAASTSGSGRFTTKKTQLGDSLFTKVRDMNFAGVGKYLNQVARQLQTDYDQRHAANTVNEIKQFVSKLGGLQALHQSLRLHTNLAEDLMQKIQSSEFNDSLEIQQALLNDSYNTTTALQQIESLIDQSVPLAIILRLLTVTSLVKGGFHDKPLARVKTHILQTYGHEHLFTFQKMQRAGLILSKAQNQELLHAGETSDGGVSALSSLKRYFVVDEQQDDFDPQDVSYAYSGYVPLSIRIIQCILDKIAITNKKRISFPSTAQPLEGKWRGTDDFITNVRGTTVERAQRSTSNIREAKLRRILVRNSSTKGSDENHSSQMPTTMVFFLGGITRAEISCIRHLEKQLQIRILIATSGIISGQTILDDFIDV